MKFATDRWKSITRRYLGDAWVKNEMGVMNTLMKQQEKLPISVEQAREQVLRLKEQSLSTVKKGHNTGSKQDQLRKENLKFED